jgi:alkylation response protein AidB-like acyl-CoA dehydrogenase
VDFRYTEEQLALQETLQRFIARDYNFEQRRAFAGADPGFSAAAWTQYAQLGLLALPFPEEYGGLNGSAVDVMAVMEQVGQGLLLEPYLSTVVLCGGILRDAATAAVKSAILPRIASGEVKLALAAYEPGGRYDLAHLATTAVAEGGGWRLSGRKVVVLDAPSADCFLVSARTAGAVGEHAGISLFLVPRAAAGVRVLPYATQSGARAGDLELSDARVEAAALIGEPGQALPVLERGVDIAIAALCAESCGIVGALNQATLAYLKSRKQFGVPIGVFQALQHRMADMYIAGEQIRSMAIIAAVNAGSEDAAARARTIAAAKAYIGQAARFVGQQAVQLHGAMGVVDDLIVSHYFKRLTMIDMTFGDADFHLARFSDAGARSSAARAA